MKYVVISFEWDEEKANKNWNKHRITFKEGITIFNDPFLLTFFDKKHSKTEDRFINIGISIKGNFIVLIHCERSDNIIRVISCRETTKKERYFYEKRKR